MRKLDDDNKKTPGKPTVNSVTSPSARNKENYLKMVSKAVEDSSKNIVTGVSTYLTGPREPVWSNKEVKVTEKFDIVIPEVIENLLNALNDKYSSVEFTILCKTEWNTEYKMFIMSDEYFIPKQSVSATHIDYEEDNVAFNTVIHKHPNGCHSFSGTDEEYINANFDFSILWVDRTFKVAQYKHRVSLNEDLFFVRVPLNVKREKVMYILPEGIEDKIVTKNSTYYGGAYRGGKSTYANGYGGGGYGGGGYAGNWDYGMPGGVYGARGYYSWSDEDDPDETDLRFSSAEKKEKKFGKKQKRKDRLHAGIRADEIDDDELSREFMALIGDDDDTQTLRNLGFSDEEIRFYNRGDVEDLNDYVKQGLSKDEVIAMGAACGMSIRTIPDSELEDICGEPDTTS
jgi:hypothetical protein